MSETILEIAYQLMLEQNKNEKILHGSTERTIFVLGSNGVVSFHFAIRFPINLHNKVSQIIYSICRENPQ